MQFNRLKIRWLTRSGATLLLAALVLDPVRDGIPVMLESEARQLTADEKLG
jgi:hypothetical protein